MPVDAVPSDVRLERLDDWRHAAGEWDVLARRSGNIFATREWCETWWEHFADDGEACPVLCRRGQEPLVMLPLYRRRRGRLEVLRFAGHGPADELGPVCRPGDEALAAAALAAALADPGIPCDLFLGERLAGTHPWAGSLDARPLLRESSPVLRIDGRSFDDVLSGRSRNFRQQTRRAERRLGEGYAVSFRMTQDPDRLQDDLDTLFALHDQRWADGSSRAFVGRRAAFHRQWAAIALERDWLRLWFLELDGRPVAAWYGFRFEGADSYYQGGRDPSLDRVSAGFVLQVHCIREAAGDGMREYRFLRGDEPYKFRFTDVDPGLETIARAGSPAGRAAVAALQLSRRARPTSTRLLDRIAGFA